MFKRILILAVLALVFAVPAALAGGVTVSTAPNPVVVGDSFSITVCGTGGRFFDIVETAPSGAVVQEWRAFTSAGCITVDSPVTTETGDYLVTVENRNGHVFVSTVETVN